MSENRRRIPRTAWRPGRSGNPGGRPRGLADVTAAARERTAEAIATLVQLMRHSREDGVRRAAAEAILDRGWGRPAQLVAGAFAVGPAPVDVEQLREALLARLSTLAAPSLVPALPPAIDVTPATPARPETVGNGAQVGQGAAPDGVPRNKGTQRGETPGGSEP